MKAAPVTAERFAALDRWSLWADRAQSARTLNAKLKAQCHSLRALIEAEQLATEPELASYWPDGEENVGKTLWNWIRAYGMYLQFLGRREDKKSNEISTDDRAVIDALRDAPVIVELEALDGAEPKSVAAYPKSFSALDFLDKRDRHIAWLTEQRAKLLTLPSSVSADALEAIAAETAYQYGLILLTVTSPGPALPFDAADLPRELPGWIAEASPVDILRIHSAFVQVNIVRLHALYALLDVGQEGKDSARPGWVTFFATQSAESNIPSEVLMRDRSLVSQVATALIAADARKRAIEESKNESNREAA